MVMEASCKISPQYDANGYSVASEGLDTSFLGLSPEELNQHLRPIISLSDVIYEAFEEEVLKGG